MLSTTTSSLSPGELPLFIGSNTGSATVTVEPLSSSRELLLQGQQPPQPTEQPQKPPEVCSWADEVAAEQSNAQNGSPKLRLIWKSAWPSSSLSAARLTPTVIPKRALTSFYQPRYRVPSFSTTTAAVLPSTPSLKFATDNYLFTNTLTRRHPRRSHTRFTPFVSHRR